MAEQTAEEKSAAAAGEKRAAAKADTVPAAAAGRKVRVLIDTADYKINDTPILSDEEAAAAVAGGWADDSPAAVKYAEENSANAA